MTKISYQKQQKNHSRLSRSMLHKNTNQQVTSPNSEPDPTISIPRDLERYKGVYHRTLSDNSAYLPIATAALFVQLYNFGIEVF